MTVPGGWMDPGPSSAQPRHRPRRDRRHTTAARSSEVSVRSMHDPKPGWTAEQALDMARQGYDAEHVERVTGYAAAWVRAQLRRRD